MASATASRRRVKVSDQPLAARLTLTIRGTDYAVTRLEPGPDHTRAWRLEKLGGKAEVYDLARTREGLVACDCPSYTSTHEGTASTCKHGQAMIEVGLIKVPSHAAAVAPEPSRAQEPPHDDASACFDPTPYVVANLVAKGKASWINAGPRGGACPPCWDASNPLKAATPVECCDPADPMPCAACVNPPEPGPVADAWAAYDDHTWALGPEPDLIVQAPARGSLEDFLMAQVEHHRRAGGHEHEWLALKLGDLLDQVKFLGARTPSDFEDKYKAALLDEAQADDMDDAWRDDPALAW